jgi:hypothetical protein
MIFARPMVKVNNIFARRHRRLPFDGGPWYPSPMTGRERLLATVRHGCADRVPWAPKFGTWLDAHRLRGEVPDRLAGCGHWHDAARRMGIDIFDKAGAVYREVHDSVRTVEEERGRIRVTRLVTPVGELATVREQVDDYARTVYVTSYPVTSSDDLRTWRYLLEDTRYEACYDDWLAADRAVGDDGIDMANLPDSPLHRIYVTMMGYEAGSLAFADRPREMDDLCRLILAKNEEAYAVAMASPAEILLTGENTNSDFESPDLFGRCAFPTLRRASELAHAAGKLHWVHACGKLRVLLPRFLEAGIDGVESLTPPPYADTPLPLAREAWGGAVTIDGGIPPHLLVGDVSDREIERHVRDLFDRMGDGRNFVLSVSDDTPVDAAIERLELIGRLVRERGRLPLT